MSYASLLLVAQHVCADRRREGFAFWSASLTLDGRFASQSPEGRRWHIRAV